MNCTKCGQELMEGTAFCPYCGNKTEAQAGAEQPIYQAEIKGLLKSGKLLVYSDRTEFVSSSVQKAIFSYTGLVAVKKGWDCIDFVTEDGHTESCPAGRKGVHEAFLYIEQAVRPYLAQRKNRLLSEGVAYSFPSSQGLLNEGILNLSAEGAQFRARSGKGEILSFQEVKSVSLSAAALDFSLFDGKVKSFTLPKDLREEVLAFAAGAIAPYLAQRKEALLARGIYFSFPGPDGKTLNILADRAEYTAPSGQAQEILFQDVRAASLYEGRLELALTNATSHSFPVDADAADEVRTFIEKAIEPYVTARTAGFEQSFGIDERIEFNEKRGVFHIIRQGGREITGEWPSEALTRCEWTENGELTALGSMVSGGIALFKSAAKAVGNQNAAEAEERISCAGVILHILAEQKAETQSVRFGIFPAGMSRTSRKYDRYLAEGIHFSDYLKNSLPACEQVEPTLPKPKEQQPEQAEKTESEAPKALPAADPSDRTKEDGENAHPSQMQDELGITRYIEGISRFIGNCTTPMTIAIQGNRGSGENSILRILFHQLKPLYENNLLLLNVRQLPLNESGEALCTAAGKKLLSLLGGENGAEAKDRAAKIATGLAKLVTGAILSDSSIGQDMAEGLFNKGSSNSPEQLAGLFSRQIKARCQGAAKKVVFLIEGLDRLAPLRAVELLEALQDFFDCEGCVFAIAADYDNIFSGAQEKYRQSFDEQRGRRFFDELFKMSFRVPSSSYNLTGYIKSKLEHMDIRPEEQAELPSYVELIQSSIGKDPEGIDRLFDSFLLLKNMADEELYEDRYQRLVLFALLCMQTKFRSIYEYMVRMKDSMSPLFLTGLCGSSAEFWENVPAVEGEKAAFPEFGTAFAHTINQDEEIEISPAECRAFSEVLAFSAITSK